MHKVWLIICREYLVRVRTKAFVIFTILMPLLVAAVVVLPSKLMMQSGGLRHIVIVAADPTLANAMKSELAAMPASVEDEPSPADAKPADTPAVTKATKKTNKPEFDVSIRTDPTEALRLQLTTLVRHGKLDGFAWIDANAVTTRKGTYYSRSAGDFIETSQVSRALRFALSERQLTEHGFSPAAAKTLLGPVAIDSVHIDRQGASPSNGVGAIFLPYLLLAAIYATVLIYGLYVMRSVIEEKSSRVVEVLLGSVTPMQLMAGKIIGVGAVGLTQIAIWALASGLVSTGGAAMAHQLIGDNMKDAHISPAVLVLFPVFFILGYATYACLYAAIGAMVNSDEEAQQLQFPVTLPLVLCMVFAAAIIRDPNTQLAFWLSIFPLTSPIIMYVRVAVSMPPAWQIATSIAVSLTSLYALVWLTSRIYRVGILMYGKRPTIAQILKWIRYA
jgi:ABC-2 type transport system permease protein